MDREQMIAHLSLLGWVPATADGEYAPYCYQPGKVLYAVEDKYGVSNVRDVYDAIEPGDWDSFTTPCLEHMVRGADIEF